MEKQKAVELDLFAPSDFGEEVLSSSKSEGEGEEVLFSSSSKSEGEGEEVLLSSSKLKGDGEEVSIYSSLKSENVENTVVSSDIASLFLRLSHSKFRSSFYLNQKDRDIIANKGLATIREHAHQIIAKRLAPAVIPNDGKQTPMRHGTSPVFIAQHATACCCRGCLEKWHHIPRGRLLTTQEQNYVVDVLMHWIEANSNQMPPK